MLDYEWANPSSVMLSQPDVVDGSDPSDPTRHHHHQSSSILDHYATTQAAFNNMLPPQPHQQQSHGALMFGHPFTNNQVHQVHSLFEPSVFVGGASSYAPHHHHSMLSSLDPTIQGHHHHHGMMLIPKSEVDVVCPPAAADFAARIGLNLGGRTYFSSEDDFMNRLYRRARPADHHHGPINVPSCQAEGCHADLSQAKHYHRRHKVCEFHSKASNVIANGLTQRFCQQCSRFHLLSEFDNGKRSCRKRLADHNRRRRKTQQQPNQENRGNNNSQQPPESTRNLSPDNNTTQSPPESASHTSSAVTVAVSPPQMGLDCFRPRQYQATTSSGSSGSLFFSSG